MQYVAHALFKLLCSITVRSYQSCVRDRRALSSARNFHSLHILVQAIIHQPILPLFFWLLKPAFSICSSVKSPSVC